MLIYFANDLFRSKFSKCKLRVFFLSDRSSWRSGNDLDREAVSMAHLLAKFRIDVADVVVISNGAKPKETTKSEFKHMLDNPSEVKEH